MRHGKSDWHAGAADDFSRPLSARGRRDSPRIGQWLSAHELQPTRILCSPAQRARDTAKLLCNAEGIEHSAVLLIPELYLADVATLLSIIAAHAGDADPLMLVGHNPGLEDLLLYLSDDDRITHERARLMPTATLAWLASRDEHLPPPGGCATLRQLLRPRDLDD